MICSGSSGTGTPHLKLVRDIDKSFKPPETKLITSLRRD